MREKRPPDGIGALLKSGTVIGMPSDARAVGGRIASSTGAGARCSTLTGADAAIAVGIADNVNSVDGIHSAATCDFVASTCH